jgi:alkaline phosphatase
LATDPILRGAVMTANHDSVITDSAAAGTAFATGHYTYTGAIGVLPGEPGLAARAPIAPGSEYHPVASVLEAARLSGRSIGTVVTATFTTATNAAYLAHTTARSAGPDIAEQGAHQGLDVFFGGGLRDFLPEGIEEGRRTDGANLVDELSASGVTLLSTRDELLAHDGSSPVWGFFAMHAMAPEIDRPMTGPNEPSLAEMTKAALSVLSQDPEGFFLMVEGSQIDWGGHQNDIANVLHDHVAFDDAVQVALDFAAADGNTLVIVAPDHNAGGLAIGNVSTYDALPLSEDDILGPIRALDTTAMYTWEELGIEDDPSIATVQAAVREAWGVEFSDAQAQEALDMLEREARDEDYDGLGEIYSRDFTHIGWVGHEHTGGDVPLFGFGPGAPAGLIAAPEIAQSIAVAMGVDLTAATNRLFAPAEEVFVGRSVTLDSSNPADLILQVQGEGQVALLPVNRNVMMVDGTATPLEGVVVHIEANGVTYVPREAGILLGTLAEELPSIAVAAN